jgi:hypothetical protein
MKTRIIRLKRYYSYATRKTDIAVDQEVHDLLMVYARENHLTMRQAANKIIAAGLSLELARKDAMKKQREMEELPKKET